MSLLTFLGLRQPKYNRVPLTLADVLHRTLVSGLAALSIYGLYLGYSVHEHVMTKGKGMSLDYTELCSVGLRIAGGDVEALALREAEAKAHEEAQAAEEAREQSLAEAAQAALSKRHTSRG